jgi:hypothetical protein
MMNEQFEKEIISRFILPERKSRYEFMLPRANQRYASLVKLFSNDEIDLRFAEEYGGFRLFFALSSLGKNTGCYIISCDDETDGKVFPFEQAMQLADNSKLGVIVYCPKHQVAYYRGEQGTEYLLHKPS